MRTSFLPFAIPTMDETDVAEVAEVVRSGWLTTGPRAQKFELEMATEIGTGGALAVSSGSAALHLALTAMDITPGSWVITTPLTFCATAHAIEHVGCRPWFVDVEPDTLNIDPAAVARALATAATLLRVGLVELAGCMPRLCALGARGAMGEAGVFSGG